MKSKDIKTIIICVILIGIVFTLYLFVNKNNSETDVSKEPVEIIKHYNSNEYVPIYIDDNKIVDIYLNEYKNYMIYNTEKAYNTLNKEYREKKFGTLENYKNYIQTIMSLELINTEVSTYNLKVINGKKIFNIYDKLGNQYIIKENSIMDYEIYLDDFTVNIE